MAEKGDAKAKGNKRANAGVWRISTVKLLIALILLFAVTPFVENLPNGDFVESGLVTLVMIASLIAVGRDHRVLDLGSSAFVPAIAGKWLHHFFPNYVLGPLFSCFRDRLFRLYHLPNSALHSQNYTCRYRGCSALVSSFTCCWDCSGRRPTF